MSHKAGYAKTEPGHYRNIHDQYIHVILIQFYNYFPGHMFDINREYNHWWEKPVNDGTISFRS